MEYMAEIAVIYNLTSKLTDLHDTSFLQFFLTEQSIVKQSHVGTWKW